MKTQSHELKHISAFTVYVQDPETGNIWGAWTAGGCVTPRSIITKIPRPTATAICKNRSTGRNFKINTPTIDVTKCPKKTFLGWAKGLSGYPKSKTIEDPNDPARNSPYGVSKLKNDKVPIAIIENIKANRALLKFSFIISII